MFGAKVPIQCHGRASKAQTVAAEQASSGSTALATGKEVVAARNAVAESTSPQQETIMEEQAQQIEHVIHEAQEGNIHLSENQIHKYVSLSFLRNTIASPLRMGIQHSQEESDRPSASGHIRE
ncbi:unnamed protein product [Mortierella alpina]